LRQRLLPRVVRKGLCPDGGDGDSPHIASDHVVARQSNVSTTILNADLNEAVYIRLPKEFGGGIWQLKKDLYGLKQAARICHFKLREIMKELGYIVSDVDPCLFTRGVHGERLIVIIHVDDGICTGLRTSVMAAIDEIGKSVVPGCSQHCWSSWNWRWQ
jgi:hypothetical protein